MEKKFNSTIWKIIIPQLKKLVNILSVQRIYKIWKIKMNQQFLPPLPFFPPIFSFTLFQTRRKKSVNLKLEKKFTRFIKFPRYILSALMCFIFNFITL